MNQAPLRLRLDRHALQHNWRALSKLSGVETGAAIKADGYGLGAREVMDTLHEAGARDFFVATWQEAEALGRLPDGARLAVFHGLGPDDTQRAMESDARPVLVTPQQVKRWRVAFADRPCDIMIDTGMNRLGIGMEDLDLLEGLSIDTLHSHLACAEQADHPLNKKQLERFRDASAKIEAQRYSLANSGGIFLGADYAFDLVRPGLALYGGIPVDAAAAHLEPVVSMEASVIQLRTLKSGDTIGYGALFTADRDTRVAILNVGYADGYPRNLTGQGHARAGGRLLPLLGRVSMDLVAVDATHAGDLREGDWLALDYDIALVAAQAGISQYEALTGLGQRFDRIWV